MEKIASDQHKGIPLPAATMSFVLPGAIPDKPDDSCEDDCEVDGLAHTIQEDTSVMACLSTLLETIESQCFQNIARKAVLTAVLKILSSEESSRKASLFRDYCDGLTRANARQPQVSEKGVIKKLLQTITKSDVQQPHLRESVVAEKLLQTTWMTQ